MRATDVLRSALMGIVEEMGLNWLFTFNIYCSSFYALKDKR